MATVHDIAAYIMDKRGPMTAMKLQKLVFYTQAWTVAITGQRAFPERIEAWAQGPVVYELFDKHRRQYVVQTWTHGKASLVAPAVGRIVDGVLGHYGELSAEALSDLTHAEAPWKQARAGIPESLAASPEIPIAALVTFYGRQPRPAPLASA